jgi:hypothetical protein
LAVRELLRVVDEEVIEDAPPTEAEVAAFIAKADDAG